MGKIKDFARNCYVGAVGNRVTLAARAVTFGGIVGLVNFYGDSSTNGELGKLASGLTTIGGLGMQMVTTCGYTTLKHYKKTRDLIRKHRKLDKRYIETILGFEKYSPFIGYCQLQGAYFAAKENGLVDEFRKLKKEVSLNVLPNF